MFQDADQQNSTGPEAFFYLITHQAKIKHPKQTKSLSLSGFNPISFAQRSQQLDVSSDTACCFPPAARHLKNFNI
jgi:hypothetical protein